MPSMSDTPMTQDQLGELIEGRSDEEINTAMAAIGVDNVLDQIFAAMQERFQPDRAAGQSAVIGWEITAPDGAHSYRVKVENGACTVEKGAEGDTRVTLGLTLPDFMRFIAGQLDGMQAFMSGKLKLTGDMMFAQTLQSWFGQ
jgi:putative sterol carrier protein